MSVINSLDELAEKSNVIFKKPINARKIENFFKYLAGNNFGVRYNIEMTGIMEKDGDSGGYLEEKAYLKISGRITENSKDSKFASSMFSCPLDYIGPKNQIVKKLSFQTIPGYNLNEHNSAERELWDKVRDLTDQYFQKNKE